MSQRGYSPRRYGRSEHAPIVIDMVDYGGEDYGDEYTYSSSHYSGARHSGSVHSTPTTATGSEQLLTMSSLPSRHTISPRHSNPRHSPSIQVTPRQSMHNLRTTGSSNSHITPLQGGSVSTHSTPRHNVHMHNFAQRRSFMMGGFPQSGDFQQAPEVESNRVYRVETEDDAPLVEYEDYSINHGVLGDSEYRQSPGRSRNFRQVDTRDRSTPRSGTGMNGPVLPHHSNMNNVHSSEGLDVLPVYDSAGSYSHFDGKQHLETTSKQHNVSKLKEPQGATFPVFDRMKHPEDGAFTFEATNENEGHRVPGVINRPHSAVESTQEVIQDTLSAASQTEKKVFYFDIDDLSQRLLNSGDQDLSRRLRKKKAKNARSRISRTRAKRKSKKSVFNLELDGTASGVLNSNDVSVGTVPDQLRLSRDSYSHFDNPSQAGTDARSALYVETSADVDDVAPKSPSRSIARSDNRSDNSSIPLRRNPSVGSAPAEHQKGILSPNATMDVDVESVQDIAKTNQASPREVSRRESILPHGVRLPTLTNPDPPQSRETSAHEKRTNRSSRDDDRTTKEKAGLEPKATSPIHVNRTSSVGGAEVELNPRKIKGIQNAEVRVAQVYDEISDRLDHIVKRENDVENRQKAIRAVFEEVQQHVADLRKQKAQVKAGSSEKQDSIVDLVNVSMQKRNVTDDGDDQVIKHHGVTRNESGDNEEIKMKLEKHRTPMQRYSRHESRKKVRSPTIEDMVSPPIAPIAPPSPVAQMGPIPMPPNATVHKLPPLAASTYSASRTSNSVQQSPQSEVIDVDATSNKDVKVVEGVYKKEVNPTSQGVDFIDLRGKADEQQKESKGVATGHRKALVSQEKRSSGYLSSDNSCDNEVVIKDQATDVPSADGASNVVYVIEEDDGKSVVHVDDKITPQAKAGRNPTDPQMAKAVDGASGQEDRRFKVSGLPLSEDLAKDTKSGDSTPIIHDCSDDESAPGRMTLDRHDNEERLEPDGNKLEPTAGKQADVTSVPSKTKDDDNSDEGDGDGSLVGLASKSMEAARERAAAGTRLQEDVLNDSDSADETTLDIDKEFEAVVPLKNDSHTVSYNIDETLDRVVRQKELEEQENAQAAQAVKTAEEQRNQESREKSPISGEKQSEPVPIHNVSATTISRREEEEKADLLLDTFSNGSIFAGVEDTQSEAKRSSRPSQANIRRREQLEDGSRLGSFINLEDEEEDDDGASAGQQHIRKPTSKENEVVSIDYDFNLAISAGSKSSSSESDLKEFPLTKDHKYENEEEEDDDDDDDDDEDDDDDDDDEEDDDDEDDNFSASSNVSSDISESTSGSETDSSYDSFISIVETEDESDLDFYEDQEGFAENFMSNLVSSTFGWIEKKQEQLVCGFKSGEFDGPSLLRESMTRQKKGEKDTTREARNNKAMKSLRTTVANKYGRENPSAPTSTSANEVGLNDRKSRSGNGKKSSRRNEGSAEAADERKKTKKAEASKVKGGPSPESHESGGLEKIGLVLPNKVNEKVRKKAPDVAAKPDRISPHVADSRKRSLVNPSKESDSDISAAARARAAKEEARKAGSRKVPVQLDEATVATTRTAATTTTARTAVTLRSLTSKKSSTSRASSRSQQSQPGPPMSNSRSSVPMVGKMSQYNFDFLSSEDDEHGEGSSSSVQVIAVQPAVPDAKRAEKESGRSTKPKKVDPQAEGRKKGQPGAPSGKIDLSDAGRKKAHPVSSRLAEPEKTKEQSGKALSSKNKALLTNETNPLPPFANKEVEPLKIKSRRSSKQGTNSPTPIQQRDQSANSRNEGASPSPPPPPAPGARDWSPSSERTSAGDGLQPARDAPAEGSAVAAEKASKRSPSKPALKAPKTSKKITKKEKILPASTSESASVKSMMSSSKRNVARSGRRKISTEERSRVSSVKEEDEETDTEYDSTNMTEEERENARKERRRAAALKRRRKLRERRRAKLEQNLTDDTLG